MNRYLAPILVGLLLAGCTSQDPVPSSDPFLVGRQRIPPPATGTAAGQVADPYYPASNVSTAPGWQPSGTAITPATGSVPPVSTAKSPDSRATAPSGAAPAATSPGSFGSPSASTIPGVSYPGVSLGGGTAARGASLQGAKTVVSTPTGQSSPLRSTAGGSLDDRTPRPIESAGVSGNTAERKPIVRTLQPRSSDAASNGVIDIADLPAAE